MSQTLDAVLSRRAAELLQPLAELDWSDVQDIRERSEPAMRALAADKPLLRDLAVSIADDPERRSICEQDYALSKYVLYNDPQGRFRVRLHIMGEARAETPHSHRNCFASLILRGGYEHTLYAPLDDGSTLIRPEDLKQAVRRWEGEGTHYVIHHSVIHHTQTKGEPCVSLMVRGPSLRRQAINLDLEESKSWWHRGAADLSESEASLVQRLDSAEALGAMVRYLQDAEVI